MAGEVIFKDSPLLFSSPSGQSIKISIRTRTRFASPSSRSIPFYFLLLPFLSYIANVASFFENRVQSHWTKERRKDGLLDIVKLIPLIRNEFFRSRISPRYDFVWTEGCGWKNRGSFPSDPFPGWEESVSTSVIRIEEKFKLQPPRSHHSPTLFLLRRQISNRTNERSYLSRQLVSEAL